MKLKLSELIDMAVEAEQEYGDLEVVLVGEDDEGQFVRPRLDVAVCRISKSGNKRTVFAFLADVVPVDTQSTLMQ